MREYLQNLFISASEKLPYLKDIHFVFEIPKQEAHGDFSTNTAMLLTKQLKKNPREIAKEIIDNLALDEKVIYKTEIAGPGFINFFFTNLYSFSSSSVRSLGRIFSGFSVSSVKELSTSLP